MALSRDSVAHELTEIAAQHGGLLLPADVVAEARSVASPLHHYFEWDDSVAAEAYRLDQARVLIRSVRVVVNYDTLKLVVPAWVKDQTRVQSAPGYIETVSLRSDADRARDTVKAEIERAEWSLQRAEGVAALLGQQDALMAILQRLREIRSDIDALTP